MNKEIKEIGGMRVLYEKDEFEGLVLTAFVVQPKIPRLYTWVKRQKNKDFVYSETRGGFETSILENKSLEEKIEIIKEIAEEQVIKKYPEYQVLGAPEIAIGYSVAIHL